MSTEQNRDEFRRLVGASGWSQVKVAEKMFTTSATVSRYMSGDLPVSDQALKLIRLILASESKDATLPVLYPTPQASTDPLHEKILELKNHPEHYALAKETVDRVYGLAMQAGRVAAARLPRRAKAASPTGSKSGPEAPSPPVADAPPAPQGRAPKKRASA